MALYQGYMLVAFLVLISASLKLSALGWSISIERDWIVCMCQSNSDLLTKINVNMKRIDLVCKLTSPLVFAGLLAQLDAGYCTSMSYAIIYINMMSVSGTMIGYLKWRGLSAGSIAFLKGICTGSELLGTVLMPVLTRYVGLVRCGAWSIWLEVATLMPVLFSIYTDRLPIQVVIFAGMALSRVGVWSFDLVVTQIMQEHIEGSAGVINGWHYSMMNVFELGQFILTMVWSNPEAYYVPCTLSFGCVVAGGLVYSSYVVQVRGHLFHYQRIASTASFLTEDGEGDPANIEGQLSVSAPSTVASPGEEELSSGVVSRAGSRSRARQVPE
ncbi:hypothetical protein BGZ92_004919 [Podila epicladia]|nr:hypothetical protein BGZ92_004919 [Podila epicladia]